MTSDLNNQIVLVLLPVDRTERLTKVAPMCPWVDHVELTFAQGEDFPIKPLQLYLADDREEMEAKGDQDGAGDQDGKQGDFEAEHLIAPVL